MKTYKLKELEKDSNHDLNNLTLLEKILLLRGVVGKRQAKNFLEPSYEKGLNDPFKIHDMEKAVGRIMGAVEGREKIVIYADYDADGIPGAVVMSDFFDKIRFENFEVYIPHRYEEGFGLNTKAIKEFSENGASLVITIDCGSSDVEPIDLANKLGIDVVVTDHHMLNHTHPEAHSIVNPNHPDCNYPFKDLCGAGVAFKLVQALISRFREDNTKKFDVPEGWEKWLLDMVGIATLSDMVPLVGENRILAKYGLCVLRKSRRPGLKALFKKLGIKQRFINEDDVVFSITPRINAASRMGIPSDAFRLLATDDPKEAKEMVDHLDSINNKRKGHVASMVREASRRVEEREEKRLVVVGDPSWKPGLVGLAAQKLSEKYGKPAFVWGREGSEIIRGSCRSGGQCSVVGLMEESKELFIEYGGHEYSGGFSISNKNVHILEESLTANFSQEVLSDEKKTVMVDDRLKAGDVNESSWRDIEKLSPFGKGNSKPIFLFEAHKIDDVSWFGKEKNHLKLKVSDVEGMKVQAISFFAKERDWKVKEGERIDLLGTLEKSYFRGRPELRVRIVDMV